MRNPTMALCRLVLVAAISASACVVVAPAPAGALDKACTAYPSTPGMVDYRLELVEGATRGACLNEMALIITQSELYEWFNTPQSWGLVAKGRSETARADYGWAFAWNSCKGQGRGSLYHTKGHVHGISYFSNNFLDGWNDSSFRSFDCTADLQAIRP